MGRPRSTRERHYPYLIRTLSEHTGDDCLVWPFARNAQGYGIVSSAEYGTTLVHRLAFRLANGRYPDPCGLHKCDNPPCYNPRHIFEGTITDNNRDMLAKGRCSPHLPPRVFGENHPGHKLTNETVLAIRAEPSGQTQRFIAEKYGTDPSQISLILNRKTWTHI